MSRTQKARDVAGTLRSLRLGDRWAYQVSGKLTRPDEAAPLALSGSIVVTVVPDSVTNCTRSLMLTFVQTLQAERNDGSLEPLPAPDLMFAFVQDPATKDASILADNMGRNGANRRARAPQVFYPGRWFLGTRYDNKLEFGEGDFVHNTLLVTGQVPVETSLGVFSSWVAEITSESPAMGKITGTDWWTPDLGAPACFETIATLPDSTSTRIQAMLSGTNVVCDRARA